MIFHQKNTFFTNSIILNVFIPANLKKQMTVQTHDLNQFLTSNDFNLCRQKCIIHSFMLFLKRKMSFLKTFPVGSVEKVVFTCAHFRQSKWIQSDCRLRKYCLYVPQSLQSDSTIRLHVHYIYSEQNLCASAERLSLRSNALHMYARYFLIRLRK